MADITIDGVDPSAVEELEARAALRGQALSDYLRAELEGLARRPDVAAVMAEVQARRERGRAGAGDQTPSTPTP